MANPSWAATSVEALGLVFQARGGASLEVDQNGYPTAIPTSGSVPSYCVRVLLGEADSGVFGYPCTDYSNPGYWMSGTAYGKVDGQSNQLISSVSACYAYYGQFSVAADLSEMGADFQEYTVYLGDRVVAEGTTGCGDAVEIDCYYTWPNASLPRVNPFWRMPDGSAGVLIELDLPANIFLPEATGVSGNRIFIKPSTMKRRVEYVSHVDVTASGDLSSFNFVDARLGVFRLPHKAIGRAQMVARSGSLALQGLDAGEPNPDQESGVAIELHEPTAFAGPLPPGLSDGAVEFTASLAPLDFKADGAAVRLDALALSREQTGSFGSVQLKSAGGSLQLVTGFSHNRVGLVVYSGGAEAGRCVLDGGANTAVLSGTPQITGATARAVEDERRPAGYSFRFDHPTTVTAGAGFEATGDEVAVQFLEALSDDGTGLPVATNAVPITSLRAVLLTSSSIPELTIVGETSRPIERPRLQIARNGSRVSVSWRDFHQMFVLEGTSDLRETFMPVDCTVDRSGPDGVSVVELSAAQEYPAFLRLNSAPYIDD